ncbi:MAG: type II toxin-antitoxin system VapB family antitoxin [Alphaproteobacteria bacterium]|nr:type II toxin-antitoxin system VapB family antitoxin [Alphaproteobacteria bacterium]
MALNIKHPDADRLARELARRRKQSITEAVVEALEAALAKERQAVRAAGLAKELLGIGDRYAALPTLDQRSDDEILGYDQHGLPA